MPNDVKIDGYIFIAETLQATILEQALELRRKAAGGRNAKTIEKQLEKSDCLRRAACELELFTLMLQQTKED